MHPAAKEHPVQLPRDEKRAAWYLRKVPLLEGVGAESIRALAALVEVREYRRRQVVYLTGDPAWLDPKNRVALW